MIRIHRYIFFDVLLSSSFAVGGFILVLLSGNALRDLFVSLVSGRLPFYDLLKILSHLLPYIFIYALPLGILTGILVSLGRLSFQNEITALKASGVGIKQFCTSIFIIVILATSISLYFNLYLAPKSKMAYRESLAEIVRDNPVNFLLPKTFIKDFDGFLIYIGKREGNQLSDFWIWQLDSSKRPVILIHAKEARFTYQKGDDAIILNLLHGNAEKREPSQPENFQNNKTRIGHFKEFPIQLPLEAIFGSRLIRKKLSMYSLNELIAQKKELKKIRANDPSLTKIDTTNISQKINQINFQIQYNFSLSFSVFSLSLVGVPLGIRVGRKEGFPNFAIAMGLGILFYGLLSVIKSLDQSAQWYPQYLVWFPNFLYQSFGGIFFYRLNRF